MASLMIVRHAQASFLAKNYDRLSALGEAQATLLGEHWAGQELRFDRVFSGPRVRQRHTASLVAAAYAVRGIAFPEVRTMPHFDEYPAESVMETGLPILLERHPMARTLHEAFLAAGGEQARRATFQRLFERVIAAWVDGELLLPGVETWAQFCLRVNEGLDLVLASARSSERVAVFTSAGPTAVALERALTLLPRQTLQMSWMPRNASWSEFLFSTQRFSLSSFNVFSHFHNPAQITYR